VGTNGSENHAVQSKLSKLRSLLLSSFVPNQAQSFISTKVKQLLTMLIELGM
jgi:hypothetical protein